MRQAGKAPDTATQEWIYTVHVTPGSHTRRILCKIVTLQNAAVPASNPPNDRGLRGPALHALMLGSGFAGLGYEMVWTQMLAVALGHESAAVVAVITAFFGGIALGAWSLQKPIQRASRPARLYAVLELAIGAWAVALIVLIPAFNSLVFSILGPSPSAAWHWSVAFGGTFVLLLPATFAMGGTLPAMERILSEDLRDTTGVGGLYAANTVGAMLGTLTGTFVLARTLGFANTLLALAMVNIACAALVLVGAQRNTAPSTARVELTEAPGHRRLAALLAATGLLGLGYEVVAIRVLSQVLENTVFTFASLLATYLFGTAFGAALYQRVADKHRFWPVLQKILIGLTGTSLLGVLMLAASPVVHARLVALIGDGLAAGVACELLIAALVFLPPTMFMGASFAHLAQSSRATLGIGRAVAINTLGAALAPLLFGVALLPVIGSKMCLLLICTAYLLLLPWRGRAMRPAMVTGTVCAVLIAVLPLSLRIVSVPGGGKQLEFVEGPMANVAVVSDPTGVRYLKVNNQYTMGSTSSRFSDRRQAHIPLLMHPQPGNALFLGLGTGATFAAADTHPDLSATAVELLPELLPMLRHFGMSETDFAEHPELSVVAADARRFVASSRDTFDVIIADVFHPARDGAAALYSREHFAAIRARLAQDGLFCQWLPLFQLDLDTLASIVATFLVEFPDAQMHLAHFSLQQPIVGLVGRRTPVRYEKGYVEDRVADAQLANDLASVRLNDDFALFGGFLAGAPALNEFSATATVNTDNHPVVAWSAPRFLFASPEPAHVRLLALVDALDTRPEDLLAGQQRANDDTYRRFAAYWAARDRYLSVGVNVSLTNDTRKMLEQIGLPLMELVELSEDFSPAYIPLVQMAVELAPSEPVVSRALLRRLEMAAPNRQEATIARQRLFP